ncbi:MAG: hypothetical protein Q8M07_09495 [Prosthecobacter sp.]|nr:hypothetical protein [Prosthecobacter sp.]
MNRYWLARAGVNHGLYELTQLREMHATAELLADDHLCAEGTETWLGLAEWVAKTSEPAAAPRSREYVLKPTAEPPPDRGEKASQAQKDYMRSLGLPVPKGLTMREASAALSAAIEGGAKERQREQWEAEKKQREVEARLSSALATVNNTGESGYGHPLKYVKKEQVKMLVDWLDTYYPRWADGAFTFESDPFEVFDKWLCPAVAGFFPELVKTSYRHEFGPGQKWRVLR